MLSCPILPLKTILVAQPQNRNAPKLLRERALQINRVRAARVFFMVMIIRDDGDLLDSELNNFSISFTYITQFHGRNPKCVVKNTAQCKEGRYK